MLSVKPGSTTTTYFETVLSVILTTKGNRHTNSAAFYHAPNPIANTKIDLPCLVIITEVTLPAHTRLVMSRTIASIPAVIVLQPTLTQPPLPLDCQG
jgi:hypothetical protein